MADLNKDAEHSRRRKLAVRGAWSYLLTLPMEDIGAVLVDMRTDWEDGTIPVVAPFSFDVPQATAREARAPAPSSPVQSSTEEGGGGEDEEDDGGEDGDGETNASEPKTTAEQKRAADVIREVLEKAPRRGMRSTDVAAAARLLAPDIGEHDVQQWLSREHKKKGDLARRGARGQYRYFLRTAPNGNAEEPAPSVQPTQTDSDLQAKVIACLAKGPGDYGTIAMAVFGADRGKPRENVRNALYYLRDRRQAVRLRADGMWELTSTPERA